MLRAKGYKVKDLYGEVNKEYLVSYQRIAAYCRSIDPRHYEDPLHKAVENALERMGVDWSLPQ